jgi:hypothetical protein
MKRLPGIILVVIVACQISAGSAAQEKKSSQTPLELFGKVIASASIPKDNADEVATMMESLERWQKAVKTRKEPKPVAIYSDRKTFLCPFLTPSVVEKALGKPDRKETGTIPFLLTQQGEKVKGPVLWYNAVGFCFGEIEINKKKDNYLFMMKYKPK